MLERRLVPFFNYPALFAKDKHELLPIIEDVLNRGAYIMQKDLTDFEGTLARYLGVKHAIGVADGTVALVIALRTLGLKSGDEVIVPSHTFVASAAAVVHAGGKPVLVDCAPDHLVDPESVRRAVTSRTRAIMPVQLNGRTANMDALQSMADEHGLAIIEDSCQALGSKFRGRFAGTFGIAGAFSFYPSKTLGCFGDGGAIVTNDDKTAELALLLRDHGRNVNGDIVLFGYNSRLDNLQAAVLDFKMRHYDEEIARRREIARIYQEMLNDVRELALPPAPDSDRDHFDIFQNYELEADRRDALRTYLDEQGVKTALQWGGKTIHQYRDLRFEVSLPACDRMTQRFMLLPMNTSLADEDARYVAERIRTFYAHRG